MCRSWFSSFIETAVRIAFSRNYGLIYHRRSAQVSNVKRHHYELTGETQRDYPVSFSCRPTLSLCCTLLSLALSLSLPLSPYISKVKRNVCITSAAAQWALPPRVTITSLWVRNLPGKRSQAITRPGKRWHVSRGMAAARAH